MSHPTPAQPARLRGSTDQAAKQPILIAVVGNELRPLTGVRADRFKVDLVGAGLLEVSGTVWGAKTRVVLANQLICRRDRVFAPHTVGEAARRARAGRASGR